jgi:hypothetical protein
MNRQKVTAILNSHQVKESQNPAKILIDPIIILDPALHSKGQTNGTSNRSIALN